MDPDLIAAATARLARGDSATHTAKALGVSRGVFDRIQRWRHADEPR
jgi:hypothetical protein